MIKLYTVLKLIVIIKQYYSFRFLAFETFNFLTGLFFFSFLTREILRAIIFIPIALLTKAINIAKSIPNPRRFTISKAPVFTITTIRTALAARTRTVTPTIANPVIKTSRRAFWIYWIRSIRDLFFVRVLF